VSKVRFLLVGAGFVLALGTAGVVASVGAATLTDPDSHGDSVASAARVTCPHGPNGVHGKCVSAIASSKSESKAESESARDDTCNAAEADEDTSEKTSARTEDASEKGAKLSKAADKTEDASEKSAKHAEDKTEKKQVKACEAAEASSS